MTYRQKIHPTIKESIDFYVRKGVPLGDFLQAVMENNLMQAMGRADSYNRETLWEICCYVYNDIPADCHGSREIYKTWIAHGGLDGWMKELEAKQEQGGAA